MPLKEDFYPKDKWLSSLLDFYSGKDSMPSRETLEVPLNDIVSNIETMCMSYANFPEDLINFLEVISNPLIKYDDFVVDIVDNIRAGYEETGEGGYIEVADSIDFLRKIFEKEKEFINTKYSDVMENNNVQFEYFSNAISTIVRVHTLQVVKEIRKVLDAN